MNSHNVLHSVGNVLSYLPLKYWTRRLIDIPILLKWAKISRSASILEIGCGSGEISRYLSKTLHCKNYIAIDTDPQIIAKAETQTGGLTSIIYQVADAVYLPFDRCSFDAVIQMDLLHHISDWKKVIREIHRVLKKNGKLVMRDYSIETFTLPGIGLVMQNFSHHPYDTMYDQIELLTYIRKNGFEITHQNDNPWMMMLVASKT